MEFYDYIITGGGASGLGLAYQMAMSNLRSQSVLIIEREAKDRNDRTWGFWSDMPTRFEHLVYHRWDQAEVVSNTFHRKYDLAPYQYRVIRGLDYFQGLREALSSVPQVKYLQARVTEITDSREKTFAQVMADDSPVGASWVFDSIFKPSDFSRGPARYHYLKQHFKGWEIETPVDTFDPRVVTLYDFRTPQKDSLRYFQILPFSRRRALVEYTVNSANLLKPHEYDRAIADYLENVRKIPRYRTQYVETGVIPLTDMPFPRRIGERVMAIGTRGGMVKPSTGYAFLRMHKDSEAIVNSLYNHGHPFNVPASPWHYRCFDSLMLQLMHRQGARMKGIILRLFKNHSIQDIFRFLDEEATFAENMRLFSSLPAKPLFKALIRVKLLRKV